MTDTPSAPPPAPARAEDQSRAPADDGPSRQPPELRPSIEAPGISTLFERVAGLFRPRQSTLREDLADALAESADEDAAFTPAERALLTNILRFREVRIEDVMVPRADIEAVDISTSLADLLTLFEANGRSRMPVYAGTLDDPRGMVHIRDVVAGMAREARAGRSLDLARVDLAKPIGETELIREVLFVPPSMHAADLMARMQAERIQMALVIDEYGGTDGLVALEDIVETLVGDIEDEHDEEEALITRSPDGTWLVNAKAEIEDVARAIGGDFAVGPELDYVDTIGGLVFDALGRVPARGEIVRPIPGYEFQILEADPRRVRRVRIRPEESGGYRAAAQ